MCTYNLTCRIQTKHDEDGVLRSLHSNRSQNLVMVVGTSAIQLQSTVLLRGEEGLIDWTFYGRSSTLFHQKVRIDTGFGAHGASRIHQGQVTDSQRFCCYQIWGCHSIAQHRNPADFWVYKPGRMHSSFFSWSHPHTPTTTLSVDRTTLPFQYLTF